MASAIPTEADIDPILFDVRRLIQLCDDIVDFIKSKPQRSITMDMFNSIYSTKCKNIGYRNMKDLLRALPHLVKIVGEGPGEVVTLSQTPFLCFPNPEDCDADECIFKKYKVKTLNEAEDILDEVRRHKEVLFAQKCSQVLGKVERIKQFTEEVVELLMMTSTFNIQYVKFTERYQDHFKKALRMFDYGSTGLIHLIDALPTDSVTVLNRQSPHEEDWLIQLDDQACANFVTLQDTKSKPTPSVDVI